MRKEVYQGVILAAGHGSRMGTFGEQLPKPLAPIANKPLMAYQLEQMAALGITDVTVVIGHLGHIITQSIGDGSKWGVKVRYVEQEKRLGLAHAVGQLEKHLDHPFLLFLGDIFFEVTDLQAMVRDFERYPVHAMLAVKEESDPELVKKNFSVHLNDYGTVKRVIEKPRYVENRLKGCGLYLFSPAIFDAIRRTPRTAMRDEYELTDAIQILIEYEYSVRVANVVKWDMNITFLSDLIACNQHVLKQDGQDNLVGEDVQIADGARLVDTVVGDGAHIASPVTLERCVVLPGALVEAEHDTHDTVFTGNRALSASPGYY